MEGHVVELAGELCHLRIEVEGVDVLGVGGDAPQAAALEGPDLDRQLRAQLGQEAVEREALALLHLPAIGGHRRQSEERVHARQPRPRAGCAQHLPVARERRGAQVRRPLAPVPGR